MLKILLAEDDESMVYLLKTLLGLEGYLVLTMSAQERVVNVINREKPDMVLLDVHLGDANGMDIMRAIRSDEHANAVKVIMCSGMSLHVECMQAGADDFLLKPYMPDELLRLIKKHTPANP